MRLAKAYAAERRSMGKTIDQHEMIADYLDEMKTDLDKYKAANDEKLVALEARLAALEGRGRVLLRPSGTEPLVRVMVEAPDATECEEVCSRLVATVERELG